MNRLLKRQFKRYLGKAFDISTLDSNVQELLKNVELTYDEYDKEKRLLENTIDLNSSELYEANRLISEKNENLNHLLEENAQLLKNRIEENKEIGTELKQYKQAMDSALLVNTFDLEGVISFVNDNFCELTGYGKSEFIGKNQCEIYYHSNCDEKILSTIESKKIWNGQLKYKSKRKGIYTLNATIFPILNAQDEITAYMSILQDITQIEESRAKALELDKAKSLFIANMSHELRTPLNSIIGFSQILRRQDKIPPKLQNYIEKINFSGEHLLKLINTILDFSKLEAGEVVLEYLKMDLYSLITTIVIQLEIQAKQKDINLNVEYDTKMGKLFMGDSLRLTQILTNLLANALKFTSSGDVTLVVKKLKKDRVRFEVQDTGIGLDKTEQEKLFKEFSQADDSTTRHYGGTGLGLSISKELVELMHGKIWVESVKGEGSSFIFEIELEELDQEIAVEDGEKVLEEVTVDKLGYIKDKRVLLVEDNPTNQLLITSMLDETNLEIDIANNGLEALNMINSKKRAYDLILMDLQMPIMNGFEVTIELRKDDKKVPIIALSANVIKEDIEKTKAIGMNDYLVKPINAEKFFTYLLKYLG